jgi:adenylate cyclase
LASDPNYAAAYAGLADAYSISADNGFQPPDVGRAEARAAALKAVALDDSLAEAHVALGDVYTNYDWDWVGGEAQFRRAIALNPNSAVAYLAYAAHLATVRRNDEAIAAGLRARELDPLSTRINAVLAATFYCTRRYDEAIAASQKGLEVDANDEMNLLILGESYLQKGLYAQAVGELEKLQGKDDNDLSALVPA